jgi:hypothetical protein
VEITIELLSGWEFAPVEENVKIQDYELAPSGNPRPGQFAYKATATETDPAFFYYRSGEQLLRRACECRTVSRSRVPNGRGIIGLRK